MMKRRDTLLIAAGCIATIMMGDTSAADNSGEVALPIRIGAEYEIVGELYVHEVATDLSKRTVVYMVLLPLRLSGPEILSRCLVSPGSRMRVVARSARRWPAFLYPDQYVVEVDSIARTVDVPIRLGLSRGNEGSSGSLNPSIYRHFK
jgi:hypothetical protein